ncbi:MAG: hypothetical protein V4457_06035 [Pseudomonadota bacterium]
MARIRTIKPEFWVDEKIGECSTNARLLFIASWSFADDKGSLERSAKQLKAQAFPYDTIDCEPLVQELLDAGLLIEYSGGDGKIYLHVNHFSEHQRIDKPGKPRVPLYAESKSAQVGLHDNSTNTPGVLHAGLGVIREGNRIKSPVDNGDNGDNSHKQRGDVRQKALAAAAESTAPLKRADPMLPRRASGAT